MPEQLIYKAAVPADWLDLPGLWVSGNPVEFLGRATRGDADGLVVYAEGANLVQRQAAVDLCAALGRHPATSRPPLVAVVSQRHRGLLADLEAAGVRRVVFRPAGARLPVRLTPEGIGQDLATLLDEVCPFLNHQPVDEVRELAYCGAYLNRLVLGRDRRLDVCENPSHRACPFYLSPRQAESDG